MRFEIYNNWKPQGNVRGFNIIGLSYHEDYNTGYVEYSLQLALLGIQVIIIRKEWYV